MSLPAHNWSGRYQVTWSFKTEILTSRSGLEQRRALRGEPRRTVTTRVTVDSAASRALDRFLWVTQANGFPFTEPRGGGVVNVRLGEEVQRAHLTSGVSQADITLDVEPGTETFAAPEIDVTRSHRGRLVFPFKTNWSAQVTENDLFPRETVDFGVGRIAVQRPVAFGSRTTQHLVLVEDDRLSDFFRFNRGRAAPFWMPSPLDDLVVLDLTGATLTVEGDEVYDEYGVQIETRAGGRFIRRIIGQGSVGGTTLIQLDDDVPDTSPIRRCALVRQARFASDDLTIEWVTATVGQAQVQVVSLPASAVESPLLTEGAETAFVDYYGWPDWLDLFDRMVNVQMPSLVEAG